MATSPVELLRRMRYVAFLVLMWGWVTYAGAPAIAATTPQFCEELCNSSTDCNTPCYVDQFHFDQDQPTTCYEFGTYDVNACCGDGLCSGPDEIESCSADCTDNSCGDCDIASDCPNEDQMCVHGCCVSPCDGDDCDGQERSCEGETYCVTSADCCEADEICLRDVWVEYANHEGDGFILLTPQCVQWPYGG